MHVVDRVMSVKHYLQACHEYRVRSAKHCSHPALNTAFYVHRGRPLYIMYSHHQFPPPPITIIAMITGIALLNVHGGE